MSFDLDRTLRWLKPETRLKPLKRRPDSALNWVDGLPLIGGRVLLDTSVYIDTVKGRSPEALDAFISFRICNHSSVCLSELTHALGRLNPGHAGTRGALAEIRNLIAEIPPQRLFAPETDIWDSAGVLAGLLFRLGGFPKGAERKCLNDALLYLQAPKARLRRPDRQRHGFRLPEPARPGRTGDSVPAHLVLAMGRNAGFLGVFDPWRFNSIQFRSSARALKSRAACRVTVPRT